MAPPIQESNKPTSVDPQEVPLEGDPALTLELPHSTTSLPVGARLSHFGDQWQIAPRRQRNVVQDGLFWLVPTPSSPFLARPLSEVLLETIVYDSRILKRGNDLRGQTSKVLPIQPKSNGQLRLILDLSFLNKFIRTSSFKMRNHETRGLVLPQGFWMMKLDIQNAYLYVSPSTRNYHGSSVPMFTSGH